MCVCGYAVLLFVTLVILLFTWSMHFPTCSVCGHLVHNPRMLRNALEVISLDDIIRTWSLCPSTDLYDECLCCDQSSMKLSSLLVGAPCGEVGLIVDLVSFEEQIVSSPSKQQLANSLQVDTLPIATRQLSQTLLQGVIVSHTCHVSEYSELYVLLCSNLLQFFFYPFAHCLQLQQQI